jgi:hypothetical protein
MGKMSPMKKAERDVEKTRARYKAAKSYDNEREFSAYSTAMRNYNRLRFP